MPWASSLSCAGPCSGAFLLPECPFHAQQECPEEKGDAFNSLGKHVFSRRQNVVNIGKLRHPLIFCVACLRHRKGRQVSFLFWQASCLPCVFLPAHQTETAHTHVSSVAGSQIEELPVCRGSCYVLSLSLTSLWCGKVCCPFLKLVRHTGQGGLKKRKGESPVFFSLWRRHVHHCCRPKSQRCIQATP